MRIIAFILYSLLGFARQYKTGLALSGWDSCNLLQIFVFVYFSTESNSVTFIFTMHMFLFFFSVWSISISELCWLLFFLCLDLPSFYSIHIQSRLSVCLFTGHCKECKNYNTLFAIVRLVFFDRRRYVCVTKGVWSLTWFSEVCA